MVPRRQLTQFADCRPRFSLRFLAVVVTLLCIWLGLVASRAQQQRLIVESLRARGIIVYYDYQIGENLELLDDVEARQASWICRLLGEDYFATVIGVDCRDMDYEPGDDDVLEIAKLSGLRFANLAKVQNSGVWMDVNSVRAAVGLGNARVSPVELQMYTSRLSEVGLASLAPVCHTLEELEIAGESIDDARITPVEKFSKLRKLTIHDSRVSAQKVEHLRTILPECDVIAAELSRNWVTPGGLDIRRPWTPALNTTLLEPLQ